MNVCLLDEKSSLCVGCGRSVDEIAGWAGMSDGQRRAVMAILPERLERLAEMEGSNP